MKYKAKYLNLSGRNGQDLNQDGGARKSSKKKGSNRGKRKVSNRKASRSTRKRSSSRKKSQRRRSTRKVSQRRSKQTIGTKLTYKKGSITKNQITTSAADPTPYEPATDLEVGDRRMGKDTKIWTVIEDNDGVKRWVRVNDESNDVQLNVIGKRWLTIDDWNQFSNNDRSFLAQGLGEPDITDETKESMDQQLLDGKYMYVLLDIDGKNHSFIHGFLDDLALGIFYLDGERGVRIYDAKIDNYGNETNPIVSKFSEWYNETFKKEWKSLE